MSQESSKFTSIDTTIYNLDKRLETLRECLKIDEKIVGLSSLILDAQGLQRKSPSQRIANIISETRKELLNARITSREKACPLSPISTKTEIKQLTEKRNNLVKLDKYFKTELRAPLGVPVSPRQQRGGKSASKARAHSVKSSKRRASMI